MDIMIKRDIKMFRDKIYTFYFQYYGLFIISLSYFTLTMYLHFYLLLLLHTGIINILKILLKK